MSLRVLINCMVLSDQHGVAGTSRALLELLKGIAAVGTDHDVRLVCGPEGRRLIPASVPFETITSPALAGHGAARLAYEHVALPFLASRLEIDVVHSPTYVSPLWLPCASVVTVHDMTWFSHASMHQGIKRHYFQRLIPPSVRSSEVTIADSDCTAREIRQHVRVPEDRVTTVYLGVDHGLFRPPAQGDVSAVREGLGLRSPYFLTVAQVHPRKNHAVMVRALELLKARGLDAVYAIAGQALWGVDDLIRDIEARGLGDQVRFLGAVPDAALPALYSGAEAVVYPSLYEGFGLPILEAMASDSACIVSNASSLPEVGGDAVLYFSPHDHEELADQLIRLLGDPGLRRRLRTDGLRRSGAFTWEATAKQVLQAYELAHRRRSSAHA